MYFFFLENENWGGECDTGRRQSPIDLNHDASVKGHFSELMFAGYEEPIENAAVTNTGHSSKCNWVYCEMDLD